MSEMNHKDDKNKTTYYKYLEESISSNPESIYIDLEESKVSFYSESSLSFLIIEDYFNNIKKDHDKQKINIKDDKIIEKEKEKEKDKDKYNQIEENKDDHMEKIKDANIDKNSTIDEIFNELLEKNNYKIENNLKSSNDFFDNYNENLSINNVISCENLEKSSIFDNNEDFLKNEVNPFEKHDTNIYDVDKNKHKSKKNMDKLGMVTLSAVVLMGSAWINKYFS